jgi:hypothetical protein
MARLPIAELLGVIAAAKRNVREGYQWSPRGNQLRLIIHLKVDLARNIGSATGRARRRNWRGCRLRRRRGGRAWRRRRRSGRATQTAQRRNNGPRRLYGTETLRGSPTNHERTKCNHRTDGSTDPTDHRPEADRTRPQPSALLRRTRRNCGCSPSSATTDAKVPQPAKANFKATSPVSLNWGYACCATAQNLRRL